MKSYNIMKMKMKMKYIVFIILIVLFILFIWNFSKFKEGYTQVASVPSSCPVGGIKYRRVEYNCADSPNSLYYQPKNARCPTTDYQIDTVNNYCFIPKYFDIANSTDIPSTCPQLGINYKGNTFSCGSITTTYGPPTTYYLQGGPSSDMCPDIYNSKQVVKDSATNVSYNTCIKPIIKKINK